MEVYQIKTYLISICKINTTETHFKADVRGPNQTAYMTVGFYYIRLDFWGGGGGGGEESRTVCGTTAEPFK